MDWNEATGSNTQNVQKVQAVEKVQASVYSLKQALNNLRLSWIQ